MFFKTCSGSLRKALPLIAASCLLGCKPESPPIKHVALPAVQVLKVQNASPEKSSFVGLYGTSRSVPLAPTQAGRITAILVKSGQYVHSGDVLAALEDRLLLEMEAQAQGEVDAARAEMEQSAATYRRSQGLDAIGGLSSGTVEERAYSWRVAQGKYKAASAALTQAQIQVAEAKIRAPEDGQIISVTGVPGQLVGAGMEVVRLATGGPEVRFKVPSSAPLTVGATASVGVFTNEQGQTVRAVIKEVCAVDSASQMQEVKLKLDHSLPVAIDGLVSVMLAPHDAVHAVRVPLTALVTEDQTHARLWSLTEGQEPHLVLRRVQIVGLRGADALVDGLTAGERVVANNDGSFKAEQPVRIVSQASEL